MMRALLIGKEPAAAFGYDYVQVPPFDAVVIGSLSLGQLLRFREEPVLQALAEGKQVFLYQNHQRIPLIKQTVLIIINRLTAPVIPSSKPMALA